MRLLVEPSLGPLSHELLIPNSKYHAHRALILASLAPGRSRIVGLSHAKHVSNTLQLLRGLGTSITVDGDAFVVEGGSYRPRRSVLSAGSSGTTLYFMIGLCALASAPVTLRANREFMRRPVQPLLECLRQLGIQTRSKDGRPPVEISAGRPSGGQVQIPGTLSQWLSGLLLISPFARRETTIEVDGVLNERPYVDLTVAMMRKFGLAVTVSEDGKRYVIPPRQEPQPATVELPPDISTAAFGLAIAALHPADILLRAFRPLNGEPPDHPEAAFLDVAKRMGLPMAYDEDGIRVRHDGVKLRGVRVDCRQAPDMLPIVSTLATFAEGETVIENIDHARLKESDRVSAMLQLNRMGGQLRVDGSRLVIQGVDRLKGCELSSFNDHRVLMSLAIAATRASGLTRLTYPNAYRISYPDFLIAMNSIGAHMECVP